MGRSSWLVTPDVGRALRQVGFLFVASMAVGFLPRLIFFRPMAGLPTSAGQPMSERFFVGERQLEIGVVKGSAGFFVVVVVVGAQRPSGVTRQPPSVRFQRGKSPQDRRNWSTSFLSSSLLTYCWQGARVPVELDQNPACCLPGHGRHWAQTSQATHTRAGRISLINVVTECTKETTQTPCHQVHQNA